VGGDLEYVLQPSDAAAGRRPAGRRGRTRPRPAPPNTRAWRKGAPTT
jgi:hypothetical protein